MPHIVTTLRHLCFLVVVSPPKNYFGDKTPVAHEKRHNKVCVLSCPQLASSCHCMQITCTSSSSSSYSTFCMLDRCLTIYASMYLVVHFLLLQSLLFDITPRYVQSSSLRPSFLPSPLYFHFHSPPSYVVLLSLDHKKS